MVEVLHGKKAKVAWPDDILIHNFKKQVGKYNNRMQ
jgi:hypothetical protein